MSTIETFARDNPDGVAYYMVPSGCAVRWHELEQRSRQCAAALVASGLKQGDGIAIFLENHVRYFEIIWAAYRVGLYYTPISRHLKADEVKYILEDCGAKAVFCSRETLGDIDADVLLNLPLKRVLLDGERPGFEGYDHFIASVAACVRLPQTMQGMDFCYSSGTTGLPKGIKRPLADANKFFASKDDPRTRWKEFDAGSVYLSTAPFYHTAPIRWNMNVMKVGGTSVMMEKFDPLLALEAIERFGVTHAQWVPTMFIRMLRLPDADRARFDLGSMRFAIHAAAPCPVAVKEQMIDWWGPILFEFYSGTELVGRTSLDSAEWLAHKGSVGRPEFGQVHIVDSEGQELPEGEAGVIYFSGGGSFTYHNDPEKTRSAYNDRGWATYGDIGYLDEEGYLYLTDRLANTIVSGGVNIYPQEAENILSMHPAVSDVAVVGVPNEEFGEEVKAVVQLQNAADASDALAAELIALCRSKMAALKCPRSVDFVSELPRADSGKLLKRLVKARYWPQASQIAH
ncbi:AMP-binding protein [Diaphorobacter sp. HDW4A]|uniref:AMP-binding protein n=1 Tax=Diaphorobacter sp. HDW4A TaxID=2714924 RepID=UPI00140797E6|nr:AMP-binding protein [Diaphorobacter sp. HDW4A]QIL81577.1 AMP-binding protein [Diaphorobacter sp. HDW4A]